MYAPRPFRVDDRPTLLAALRAAGFGTMVSCDDGGLPHATSLPFVVVDEPGGNTTLLAHMARANPQWRTLRTPRPVLWVVRGPHAYISPSWYVAEYVPTWNYVEMQVRGEARLLGEDDPAARRRVLERTAAEFEGRLPDPWDAGLHPELVTRLAPRVVALEVRVSSLEGRWKLGQDKPEADRVRVIAHLDALGGEAAAVARLMAEHAP